MARKPIKRSTLDETCCNLVACNIEGCVLSSKLLTSCWACPVYFGASNQKDRWSPGWPFIYCLTLCTDDSKIVNLMSYIDIQPVSSDRGVKVGTWKRSMTGNEGNPFSVSCCDHQPPRRFRIICICLWQLWRKHFFVRTSDSEGSSVCELIESFSRFDHTGDWLEELLEILLWNLGIC